MSVIHNDLLLAGDDAYNLTRSLRFRSSASAYLTRTPTTPTNQAIWTWSSWIKRGSNLGSAGFLFAAGTVASNDAAIYFETDNTLVISKRGGFTIGTTAVYRDPSSWYHIVVAYDSTQGTSSNRLKVYVNGTQVTALNYSTYPTLNETSSINSTATAYIGKRSDGNYFDGYYAEQVFVDGQALTPSSFGSTNAQTGVWQPKRYAGTYGTNGFYLPFTDNSALTSGSNAGLGKDFSGNGNYWNTNNISITAGSTYDSMTDVPTLTSATASNFAVLNPIVPSSLDGTSGHIINGNLRLSTSTVNSLARATVACSTSGKFYAEATITLNGGGNIPIGVTTFSSNSFAGGVPSISYRANGVIEQNGSTVVSGLATFTTGDVISMAVNMDAGEISWYKNNTLQVTRTNLLSVFGTNDVVMGGQTNASSSTIIDFNFGQRPFAYTPPTGFVALNTYNLPTPTIGATASTQANKYMDVTTYTGNGSTGQNITNSGGFSPDLFWAKARSYAGWHALFDRIRGANSFLASNSTNAEDNNWTGQSFTSNGFTVNGTYSGETNLNGQSFVAWQWKANGSGSSNTAGSITSTVSANTSAGFSVVTWTGNGSAATIGHGLGVAPKMIIVKVRNAAGDNWGVYHSSIGNTGGLLLNLTNATGTNIGYWNNTSPTSTVFSVGTFFNTSNNYVAYCFAEVAGYSKFTSYTGNGSADGSFIYLGFRPRFIMIKRTDSVGHWIMYDTARDAYNITQNSLRANVSDAENQSYGQYDIVSNGFKIRTTDIGTNASGGSYVVAAFAENPFKYSLAR